MSWEDWIMRQSGLSKEKTVYDVLAEMAVSSYDLNKRNRKAELKDKCQFFILWWMKNRNKMNLYTSTTTVGKLMGCDHSTILHYVHRRKPTIMYEENTRCINDFLNS